MQKKLLENISVWNLCPRAFTSKVWIFLHTASQNISHFRVLTLRWLILKINVGLSNRPRVGYKLAESFPLGQVLPMSNCICSMQANSYLFSISFPLRSVHESSIGLRVHPWGRPRPAKFVPRACTPPALTPACLKSEFLWSEQSSNNTQFLQWLRRKERVHENGVSLHLHLGGRG